MKKYLNFDEINTKVTPEVMKSSFEMVKAIYSYDKCQPYQNYRCSVMIKNSHIKKYGTRFFLFIKNADNKLLRQGRPCNGASIPQDLLDQAAKSKYAFTHIVVERRLHYNDKQEVRIIIGRDQKQLGYFSNKSTLSKKGLAFLEGRDFLSLRKKMLLKLHILAHRLHDVAKVFHLVPVSHKAAA